MDQQPLTRQLLEGDRDRNEALSASSATDTDLSMEDNDKVASILDQVSELTDVEKYLLYLKLPTDDTDESSKNPPTSMAKRTNAALTWIRNQYMEDRDVCVPKQEVYEHYRGDCEVSDKNPLSIGDFGKVIKLAFPNIQHRRLGQRGQSRYVYWGLKKRDKTDPSGMAEMRTPTPSKEEMDLCALSCQLVCEWASQLLDKPFMDIKSLSEYLVSVGLSCGKTAAKFSLLLGSTSPPRFSDKERKSPNSKHQDIQMWLHRKLQHKEIIQDHKQKLKQQLKHKREQHSVKTLPAKSAFSPANLAMKEMEKGKTSFSVVPGRKLQPRPLSVQPYMQNTSCSQACDVSYQEERGGTDVDGSACTGYGTVLVRHSSEMRTSQDSTKADKVEGQIKSNQTSHTFIQPKRCHSTSVVEKCSVSPVCKIPDIQGKVLDTGSVSRVMTTTTVKVHTGTSADLTFVSSSSSEDFTSGFFPSHPTKSGSCASRNITRMLQSPIPKTSTSTLLLPQHPKRNGDTISPDRSLHTKRRCMTSLGVSKQQSLDVNMTGKENHDGEFTRTRPYSCPIGSDDSDSSISIERVKSFLDHSHTDTKSSEEISKENKPATDREKIDTEISKHVSDSNLAATSEKRRGDERRSRTGPQQKKNSGQCHFVQKPTVINRPINVLPSVTSCPEFTQTVTRTEKPQQQTEGIKSTKPTYNILNSLLSSHCEEPQRQLEAVGKSHTLPLSCMLNTQVESESSKPNLHSSPLRLITSTPHTVENTGILSSLSSRSAFVPVTSHKLQVANPAQKETQNVITVPSSQNQPKVLNEKEDNEIIPSSKADTSANESHIELYLTSKSASANSSVGQAHDHRNSGKCDSGHKVAITDAPFLGSLKLTNNNLFNTASSSSSSSSSTLVHSGESTSSGGESAFTTPVPVSAAEKSDTGAKSILSALMKTHPVTPTTISTPTSSPVAHCKPSPSMRCTTPVQSSQIAQGSCNRPTSIKATSPITPPKRSSRNRFTPIRPKLGAGSTTPSPQKLVAGSTTPSPQKKDMRPVSAILKEQRVKSAQDLLVNLANSYQGEVKLKMPAELLGLSPPGKSKSSDVLVTIGPPSSCASTGQHPTLQTGISDLSRHLWPLTSTNPPHKEITVVVEPASYSTCQTLTSPTLSSCFIPTSPGHVLQSIPPAVSMCSLVLPQPLFSPTPSLGSHTHIPVALSTASSAAQVIIVSPSKSCTPTPQDTTASKSIIVQDEKGNRYALDKKSGSAIIPHTIEQLVKSTEKGEDVSKPSSSVANSSAGLLNVSQISGQIVGPDAHGQTYLLVPNSEPAVSAPTSTISWLSHRHSPLLATTLVTTSCAVGDAVVTCVASSGIIQPHASSSSALLSELSQLASAGQNVSGQVVIQHNSGSSAFHKCSSSVQRKVKDESLQFDIVEGGQGERQTPCDKKSCNTALDTKDGNSAAAVPSGKDDSGHIKNSHEVSDTQESQQVGKDAEPGANEEFSSLRKGQGMRKRKASISHDDHEDKKRPSSCKVQREADDDVFIVKFEDKVVQQPVVDPAGVEGSRASVTGKGEELTIEKSSDTDTLLSMTAASKSMTVKEAIKVLHEMRAKQNKENYKLFAKKTLDLMSSKGKVRQSEEVQRNEDIVPRHCHQGSTDCSSQTCAIKRRPKSVTKIDRMSVPFRCSSTSPYSSNDDREHSVNKECLDEFDRNVPKVHRSGRRHISLNLESLESDALLDTEPALDQKLVGDIRDVKSVRSDQKTSVGVAAKTAKSGVHLSSTEKRSENKSKDPITISSRAIRSYHMLLSEKKALDNTSKMVSHKPFSSHSNNAVPGKDTEQVKKPVETISLEPEGAKQRHPSEIRRSMSCVRDMLQHGSLLNQTDNSDRSSALHKAAQESKQKFSFTKGKIEPSFLCGRKTTSHPLLAQQLSISTPALNITGQRKAVENLLSSRTQLSVKTTLSLSNKSDKELSTSGNELPGDILDFITESMPLGNPRPSMLMENSLSSLVAELVRKGHSDSGTGFQMDKQNTGVLRSMSVPNTLPDKLCTIQNENFHFESDISVAAQERSQMKMRTLSALESQGSRSKDGARHVQSFSEKASVLGDFQHQNLIESFGDRNMTQSVEHDHTKDIPLQQTSPSLDSHHSSSSGTFLSPIGPAKLTRRSSVERSSSGDRSASKTPVDIIGNKSATERPPSRIKTPVDSFQVKAPVDRSLTKTPIDRSLSKLLTDRTGRKTPRELSPSKLDCNYIKDQTTAVMLQQMTREREKQSVKRALTRSPADNHCHINKLTQQDSLESSKGDRSLSQTPVSDPGYSSVSPSPIMMSTPGLLGECGRRDVMSPATIFMPLRSDSALSLANGGRTFDAVDSNTISVRACIPVSAQQNPYLSTASDNFDMLRSNSVVDMEKQEYPLSLNVSHSQESSLLQDALDSSLFDPALIMKETVEFDFPSQRCPNSDFKDTSAALFDIEKLLSAQLHCIPTPPCSPSSSPRHISESVQSPLPFSIHSPPHTRHTKTATVFSPFVPPLTSATTASTIITSCTSHGSLMSCVSPGIASSGHNSPNVVWPPNISPSPHGNPRPSSSPHQYNPHPSPPFTPSSQRCLASPRCPTPCSHRSLMSPRCATPCGDSNSAPNRFMPIQTSGILTMSVASSQTYIQPIKPVVTLASVANHSNHYSTVFSKPDYQVSRMLLNMQCPSGYALSSDLVNSGDQNGTASNRNSLSKSNGGTRGIGRMQLNITSDSILNDSMEGQNTVVPSSSENRETEGSGHPALVLSLTGSIGSVSGQGMKTGWSRDIAGQKHFPSIVHTDGSKESSFQSQKLTWERTEDDTDSVTDSRDQVELNTANLPTYEEAVSLLTAQSNDSCPTSDSEKPRSTGKSQGKVLLTRSENFEQRTSLADDEFAVGLNGDDQLIQLAETDSTGNVSGGCASVINPNRREDVSELHNVFSSQQNLNEYPFSLQLALLSGQSRSGSAQHQHGRKICKSQRNSLPSGPVQIPQYKNEASANKESSLTTMLQAPPFDSRQSGRPFDFKYSSGFSNSTSFKSLTDLPNASYAGKAPNVDLTKTGLPLPTKSSDSVPHHMLPTQRSGLSDSVAEHQMNLGLHLDEVLDNPSTRQDDLDDTLDVLKSLDSQYFQPDEDGSNFDQDSYK